MDEVVLEPYIYIYCQLFFLVFLNSFGGSSSLSNYVVLCVIIFCCGSHLGVAISSQCGCVISQVE
jgi:hypothetical protein